MLPEDHRLMVFSDSINAFNYLIANVSTAKEILNTRLSARDPLSTDAGVAEEQKKMDKCIRKALRQGTHYSLLVSEAYSSSIDELKEYCKKKKCLGQFRGRAIVLKKIPIINFILLIYEDHSEVLFGWAISHNYDHSKPVMLIRDTRITDFFSSYHDRLLTGQRT